GARGPRGSQPGRRAGRRAAARRCAGTPRSAPAWRATGRWEEVLAQQAGVEGRAGLAHPPVEIGLLPDPDGGVVVLGHVEGLVPAELDQTAEQAETQGVLVMVGAAELPEVVDDLLPAGPHPGGATGQEGGEPEGRPPA